MIRREAIAARTAGALFLFLALLICSPTAGLAGQEIGNWELGVFGGRTSLDDQDPFALEETASFDFGGPTIGTLSRSLEIDDGTFLGFRLGYVWGPILESEIVYDRNHARGTYRHTVTDLNSGATLQDVEGRVGSVLTSYQVGVLIHPLGKRLTRWQPYAAFSGGWMDVDFKPSATLRSQIHGGLTENAFGAEFEKGDGGIMLGYGIGMKYFLRDIVALRAEARGKSYELFGERRDDYEITVGVSFFSPSESP